MWLHLLGMSYLLVVLVRVEMPVPEEPGPLTDVGAHGEGVEALVADGPAAAGDGVGQQAPEGATNKAEMPLGYRVEEQQVVCRREYVFHWDCCRNVS